MITKEQVKISDGHAGVTASGLPVIYLLSKGGLHMFLTQKNGKIEALAAAPHIGIARFFAEKKAGGINWGEDYMLKSEDLNKAPAVSDEYGDVSLGSDLEGNLHAKYRHQDSVKTRNGNLVHIYDAGGNLPDEKNRTIFTITHNNQKDGKPISQLEVDHFGEDGEGPQSQLAWTHPAHRGKGLNSDLHRLAVRHFGSLRSDNRLSEASNSIWGKMKNNPDLKVNLGDTRGRTAIDETHDAKWIGNRTRKNENMEKELSRLQRPQPYKKTEELDKGLKGDWENEGYTLEHESWNDDRPNYDPKTHDFYIRARDKKGRTAGYASITHEGNRLVPAEIAIQKEHQRKGIASAIYSYAQKLSGKKISPSDNQSKHAEALWAQPNRPFGKSEILENYLELRKSFFNGEKITDEEAYCIYNHKEKQFDIMDKDDLEYTLKKGNIAPYSFLRRIDIESVPKILGI